MNSFFSIYYTENQSWIKFVIKWFVVSAVLGAITFLFKPDLINEIVNLFDSKFGPDPVADVNLAKEIFIQNLTACLIALVGGLILGITSFLIVVFNGFIIGFVVLALLTMSGDPGRNALYVVLGLVPHGIFELPAFFLASGLGIRLGLEWLHAESGGHRFEVLGKNLMRVVYSLPILILLLLIAAFVEVFVSGQFVDKL